MRYLGVTIISPHKGPNTTSRVAQLCWTCPADSMLGIREEFGDGIWTRSILLSYPAHHHIILYIICIYFSVVFIDTWMDVYFTIQWYAGHRAQNRCIYSLKRHWGWSSSMLEVWDFLFEFWATLWQFLRLTPDCAKGSFLTRIWRLYVVPRIEPKPATLKASALSHCIIALTLCWIFKEYLLLRTVWLSIIRPGIHFKHLEGLLASSGM